MPGWARRKPIWPRFAADPTRCAEAAQAAPAVPAPSGGFRQSNGADAASLDGLRQRIQSGDATPEELAQLRQQLQGRGQFGGGGFGGGRLGGGGLGPGLTGTIDAVDGNVITVDTPQGPLQATVIDETAIQLFSEGSLADLLEGSRVTVIGQREDGAVAASAVLLLPEEGEGFFGGGNRFFGPGPSEPRQAP